MKRFLGSFIIALAAVVAAILLTGCLLPGFSQAPQVSQTAHHVDSLPAAALSSADNALAATAASPDEPQAPTGGATQYLMIGGWEFKPTDTALTYSYYGSGMFAVIIPDSAQNFRAPIHLPNAAQVTRVTFYIVDDSSTKNMTLQFYRSEPAANTSNYEIGFVTTAGLPTSTAVQAVTIYGAPILTVINNLQYAYCLRYAPAVSGITHILVGAMIEYTVAAAFLPLVMK